MKDTRAPLAPESYRVPLSGSPSERDLAPLSPVHLADWLADALSRGVELTVERDALVARWTRPERYQWRDLERLRANARDLARLFAPVNARALAQKRGAR